ncbi:hypothetical protein Clacol_005608 [Clathrus columnatus]|uniref:PPIase cyclophilin-type domain-containing protein n=1 Tax=Clathrus columnatus TaxID=1419009 RepID=A0AAV5AFV9_9AGAM|nr:hypothetical protein Clacol_005608 [Clathrus columnatus]
MATLPTKGRVLIVTTAGDIEIELWAKAHHYIETPKACRNFIALALEGYYDNVIFHRVISNFLVQTGDRTGTGNGGESFYGEPFEDEIHPRLRFTHRGLVGMANNGEKDTNDSQFFITLDRADELHDVLKIGQSLTENDRPPKIRTVKILENPFDDIVPRITAAEKRAQQLAKEQSIREREEASRKKNIKKNTKLLSFGQDAEAEDEDAIFKKKNIMRPDLIQPDTMSISMPQTIPKSEPSSSRPKESGEASRPKEETKKREADLPTSREKNIKENTSKSDRRKDEIAKMEASIRRIAQKRAAPDSESEEETDQMKKQGVSLLQAEISKYKTRTVERDREGKKKRKDESDMLAILNSFKGKLQTVQSDGELEDVNGEEEDATEEGQEIDNDRSWLSHRLHFPKDDTAEIERAHRDYEVIDPRNRSARAKEEEAERRRNQRKHRPGHGQRNR